MKERGILFSGAMVRAILSGAKTQTRRVAKDWTDDGTRVCREQNAPCPYGGPGDRLWVRETWCYACIDHGSAAAMGNRADYRADHAAGFAPCNPWRPSIHMPRWASRITLEIVAVRVERVQDIDTLGAAAEGTPDLRTTENGWDLRDCFVHLWDSINGKRPGCAWRANPYVWVVEFRRMT